MNKTHIATTTIFILLFSHAFSVTLPSFFCDNMVLQQNDTVHIWGWGKALEEIEVSVSWNDSVYKTIVNNNANWDITVKTPKAGGPYEIKVKGFNLITVTNVLIGEVWLCGGQSNMEWRAAYGINNAASEIASANHPNIRFFTVEFATAPHPQNNLQGNWEICTPETMKNFSAIAYFFAREIRKKAGDVPIGLLSSNWGGTPIEPWIPKEVVEKDTFLQRGADMHQAVTWCPHETGMAYNAMIAPLKNYNIAGILWYQGESNIGNSSFYTKMSEAHINAWRNQFGKNIPFLFAQIAPYGYAQKSKGVEIRDAQRRVRTNVENTGMVVISDIGNLHDIHPRNKQDVGLRFANIALKNTYGFDMGIVEGPLFDHITIKGSNVEIYFRNDDGLAFKNNDQLFEIAGNDQIFHKANAIIKKNKVHITSQKVNEPKYVRFAWGNTTESNLFNSAGLPASSFTTIEW